MVGAAVGQHREIGVDAGRARLQEQVIVLRGEGEALDIPGAEPDEALAGLELQIDLEADVALQPIDLIRRVHRGADARIAAIRRCCAQGGEPRASSRAQRPARARRPRSSACTSLWRLIRLCRPALLRCTSGSARQLHDLEAERIPAAHPRVLRRRA